MSKDPENPFDDREVGLAALSAVLFCAVTGLGVGAFVQAPVVGGFGGAMIGIVCSVLLIPALMREWH